MKIIVGLGNPGTEHSKNRHNLGFMALDEYAKKHLGPEIIWGMDNMISAEVVKLPNDLWLVKPQTYMNKSGVAVKKLFMQYSLSINDLIVIYDDLDIPLGKVRIRTGGSAAGHHGVESIINLLEGQDGFVRVRGGIGSRESISGEHKTHHFNAEKYVVTNFRPNEKSHLKEMLKKIIEALDVVLEEGIEVAQNKFN